MNDAVPAWVSRYVGIPFADQGADHAGCNCWGLVRLVLAEQRAIMLPSYGELSAADMLKAARAFRDDSTAEPWRAVARDAASMFDVVLMRAMVGDEHHRIAGHVGILISPQRVLHVWRATDALHMPVEHRDIKVTGFYRHRDLMQ